MILATFSSRVVRTGDGTRHSPRDTIFSLVLLVVIALGDVAHTTASNDRVFTDNRGQVFDWTPIGDNEKNPKIIINAKGALSLFHLGMSEEQLMGVYDSWRVVELDTNPSSDTGTSMVLIPSSDEQAFLESATINLTPQCSTQSPMDDSCSQSLQFNVEDLEKIEYDFIIAQGVHQRDLVPKEAELGRKIIWINERFQPDEGCYSESPEGDAVVFDETICEANSLIDSVRHLETLAAFLGIEPTPKVLDEQKAMCQTASKFVEHAKNLHQRGIHVAAGYLSPFNGGTVSVFAPSSYPWLRTLEELGLPLLHPPREQDTLSVSRNYLFVDWFPNCNTDTSDVPLNKCSELTATAIPVDLWLWWTPVYERLQQSVQSYEDIRSVFPDPALTARQNSFFISNGAAAISYTNIRRYLEAIQEATTNIARIHNKTIECTEDLIVKSSEYNTPGGDNLLRENEGGAYNCFNQDHLQNLYTECPTNVPSENDSESITTSETSSTSGGTVVTLFWPVASFTVFVAIFLYP